MTPDKSRPSVMNPDGSPNAKVLKERFGLLPEDVTTGEFEVHGRRGSPLKMLNECPYVADKLEEAYHDKKKGGVSAVVDKIEELRRFAGKDFEWELSEKTLNDLQAGRGKKIEETKPNTTTTSAHETPIVEETKTQKTETVKADTVQPYSQRAIDQPIFPLPKEEKVSPSNIPKNVDAKAPSSPLPTQETPKATSPTSNTVRQTRLLPVTPQILESTRENQSKTEKIIKTGDLKESEGSKPKNEAKTVKNTPKIEGAQDTKDDLKVSDKTPREIFEEILPTQEVREKMTEIIDTLLSKIPEKAEDGKEAVVGRLIDSGKITLGAVENLENIDPNGEVKLKAITTQEELIKVLDILSELFPDEALENLENLGEGKQKDVLRGKAENLLKKLSVRREKKEDERPKDINLLVSEDILTFLESGNKIFEEMNMKEEEKVLEESLEKKQMVRVLSNNREISIELENLKKMLELLKARKEMKENEKNLEFWAMPEELGLHGLYYRKDYDDNSLLKMLVSKVCYLASADQEELSKYYYPQTRYSTRLVV
ncbi:MAG TPA: hypothetical protein VF189_06445 [Patescibacteria group bacterium]